VTKGTLVICCEQVIPFLTSYIVESMGWRCCSSPFPLASHVAALNPLVASWHQWHGKNEMKKETYMARELENMSG